MKTPETASLPGVAVKPVLKVTISGDIATGKSVFAQYLFNLLLLNGHEVSLIERFNGDKVRELPRVSQGAQFRDARDIRIEVKEAKAVTP